MPADDFEREEKQEAQEDEAFMQGRPVPASELDLQAWTINPEWGQNSVSKDLIERLKKKKKYVLKDRDGNVVKDEAGRIILVDEKDSSWGVMSYYSRDFRLGNLEPLFGDMVYCQHYTDLAGDLLQLEMPRSFMTSLGRTATILELSQSKKGFFRRRIGTRTREQRIEEIEPPRRSLLGGRKQQQGGY